MNVSDVKYWADYTVFIETVESMTCFSPADLLHQYEEIIFELENENEYQDEWDNEFEEDMYVRKQIQKVIESPNLINNILLKQFQNKIEILDSQFKKHIENNNDSKWWENPKFKH